MRITDDQMEVTDFDWFGVDEDGLIAHFASAGFKRLPESVVQSAEDLQTVADYFNQLAPSKGAYHVDPELASRPPWATPAAKTRYLKCFGHMAERGLYSFDIDSYLGTNTAYFRVAIPESPVTIHELPGPLSDIVKRTLLSGIRLRTADKIPYAATLEM